MILTVTLNSAVDKTYSVDNFAIDRVYRPSSWRIVAGGKGINVARVYKSLGGEAIATGFIGGGGGDFIQEGVRAEEMKSDFVRTDGESRVCIAIIDPINATQTELNEVGPQVSHEEVERLRLKFESLVPGMKYAVLSGSIPPSVPDTIYAELIEIARHYGVPCVLDASGCPLEEGLKAFPLMAKPNVHELSALSGRQLATIEEVAQAALEVHHKGIRIVAVTLGRDGAIVITNDEAWRCKPPEITFVSAVGSGDAFTAAFVYEMENGGSASGALRLGVGAGAANAAEFGAGFCKTEEIMRLAEQSEISRIELTRGES